MKAAHEHHDEQNEDAALRQNHREEPRSSAYLVRVDLVMLAHHLRSRDDEGGRREWDELSAAKWLTHGQVVTTGMGGSYTTETIMSPFAQSEDWGVFYTEEDPETLLEESEIISIRNVPVGFERLNRLLKVRRGRNKPDA